MRIRSRFAPGSGQQSAAGKRRRIGIGKRRRQRCIACDSYQGRRCDDNSWPARPFPHYGLDRYCWKSTRDFRWTVIPSLETSAAEACDDGLADGRSAPTVLSIQPRTAHSGERNFEEGAEILRWLFEAQFWMRRSVARPIAAHMQRQAVLSRHEGTRAPLLAELEPRGVTLIRSWDGTSLPWSSRQVRLANATQSCGAFGSKAMWESSRSGRSDLERGQHGREIGECDSNRVVVGMARDRYRWG